MEKSPNYMKWNIVGLWLSLTFSFKRSSVIPVVMLDKKSMYLWLKPFTFMMWTPSMHHCLNWCSCLWICKILSVTNIELSESKVFIQVWSKSSDMFCSIYFLKRHPAGTWSRVYSVQTSRLMEEKGCCCCCVTGHHFRLKTNFILAAYHDSNLKSFFQHSQRCVDQMNLMMLLNIKPLGRQQSQ